MQNNKWTKLFIGRNYMIIMIGIFAVLMISSYFQEKPRNDASQSLIGLNEPMWPQNPTLEKLTYNSFVNRQMLEKLLPSDADKETLNRACLENTQELRNASNMDPAILKRDYMRNLICLRFKGAVLGESYYSLSSVGAFEAVRDRLVAQVGADTVQGKTMAVMDLSRFSLDNFRKPDFYKNMGIKESTNLSIFCNVFQKDWSQAAYYSDTYEEDTTLATIVSESCWLVNYYFTFGATENGI